MSDNTPKPPAPLSPSDVREYLEYALSRLIDRRDDLAAALTATIAMYPSIEDDTALGLVAENRRMGEALLRAATEQRKASKKPFLDGGRAVDGWFSGFAEPVETALTALRRVMDDYGTRKFKAAQAAAAAVADAAREEALRLTAEAEAAAAAPGALFDEAADAKVDEAADAQLYAAALTDQAANLKAADVTRTSGVYGAVTSMRTNWTWRVVAMDDIPREYMIPNDAALRLAMKPRSEDGRPSTVIPGIEWVPELRMMVR